MLCLTINLSTLQATLQEEQVKHQKKHQKKKEGKDPNVDQKEIEFLKKELRFKRNKGACESFEQRDWQSPEIDRAGAIADDCAINNLPRTQHRDLNETLTYSPFVSTVQGPLVDAPSLGGQRSSLTRFVVDGGDYTNLFFGTSLGHPESMDTALIHEFQVLTPGSSKTTNLFPPPPKKSAEIFSFSLAGDNKKLLEQIAQGSRSKLLELLPENDELKPVDFFSWGGGLAVTEVTRPYDFHVFDAKKRPLSEIRGETFTNEEKPSFRSFSGGASGDPNCRSRSCPYSFNFLRFKRDKDPAQAAGQPVISNNLPVRGFADPGDFKAFDVQAKPSFELGKRGCYNPLGKKPKFKCPLLTISAQYVNFFAGNKEFDLLEEESLQEFFRDDQILYVSPSLFSKLRGKHGPDSNRFRATFAHERRSSLPVALDPETETVLPTFEGQTIDRYQHIQISNDLLLSFWKGQLHLGGEWLYHRNRRDLLDQRLRRDPPTVQNKTYALYAQYHRQIGKFHLDLGLRWDRQEFQQLLVDPFETKYGELIGNAGFPSDGSLPDQSAFQPRLGLAWATKIGGWNAIFRAGAGRYFARQTLLNQLVAIEGTGEPKETDIAVPPERPDVAIFSKDYQNPRVDAANLGFQLQLGAKDAWIYVDYQHSKGVHLTRYFDLNRSDEDVVGDLAKTDSKGYILPPDSGNRVLYTDPPAFEKLGEVLVVQSSAKSLYYNVTLGLRSKVNGLKNFGDIFANGRVDVAYTYSIDMDDSSSENHLFSRPFNRLDFNQDYSRADRDIPNRFHFFITGDLPKLTQICSNSSALCKFLALLKDPDSISVRFRKYSAQPSSFNPINKKGFGPRCSATNSATRVVEGYDCGRNHLRSNDGFSSFDVGVSWNLARRVNLVIDAMNIFDSKNRRHRQDLLRDPFLLESRRTPFEIRAVLRFFFGKRGEEKCSGIACS